VCVHCVRANMFNAPETKLDSNTLTEFKVMVQNFNKAQKKVICES